MVVTVKLGAMVEEQMKMVGEGAERKRKAWEGEKKKKLGAEMKNVREVEKEKELREEEEKDSEACQLLLHSIQYDIGDCVD